MQTFEKDVKVGKIQRYVFDVSTWLAGGTLTSATATSDGVNATVSPCDINGGEIGFFATGVLAGRQIIHLSYATSSQSDCDDLQFVVNEC